MLKHDEHITFGFQLELHGDLDVVIPLFIMKKNVFFVSNMNEL